MSVFRKWHISPFLFLSKGDNPSERKISDIKFRLQLDGKKISTTKVTAFCMFEFKCVVCVGFFIYFFIYHVKDLLINETHCYSSSLRDMFLAVRSKICCCTSCFKLAEKSEDHACLVHKLLSQYIDGETSWVEKYSTSRHVPTVFIELNLEIFSPVILKSRAENFVSSFIQLLHDVSLVVSRCRLLGEELRLLKMWGGLKFKILSISCVDSRQVLISDEKRNDMAWII